MKMNIPNLVYMSVMLTCVLLFVNACTRTPVVIESPKVSGNLKVSKPSQVLPVKPPPKDRCSEYIPDIRAAAIKYLGLGYPYWYNIGVAMTESSCRADRTSFDGGIGLFQLTPSTGVVKEVSKYIPVNPYNTESNIHAHAYYIHRIISVHFKQGDMTLRGRKFNPKTHVETCGLRLADVYGHYNSGSWRFAEAAIGPTIACSNNDMAARCVRDGTCVGKQYLSFCEISYTYPIKVWNYTKPYKMITDGAWLYWYAEGDKVLTVKFTKKPCP